MPIRRWKRALTDIAQSSEQALDVIDEFLRQRDDQQLLQAGYSIARDAGIADKQQ